MHVGMLGRPLRTSTPCAVKDSGTMPIHRGRNDNHMGTQSAPLPAICVSFKGGYLLACSHE